MCELEVSIVSSNRPSGIAGETLSNESRIAPAGLDAIRGLFVFALMAMADFSFEPMSSAKEPPG
jgi:hypothetical protein